MQLDQLLASDALLLGRVTFTSFALVWPTVTDEEEFGRGKPLLEDRQNRARLALVDSRATEKGVISLVYQRG